MPQKFVLNDRIVIVAGRDDYFLVNINYIYIGKAIANYGEYCGIEAELQNGLVRPGDVVIEVGANIGFHTVPLAKSAGKNGRVYAFEPQRACYSLLEAQIALNQLDNIHAYRRGMGRTAGKLWAQDRLWCSWKFWRCRAFAQSIRQFGRGGDRNA